LYSDIRKKFIINDSLKVCLDILYFKNLYNHNIYIYTNITDSKSRFFKLTSLKIINQIVD